ncbi:uncharacterized protein LOC135383083 [Ornithodoros turicata]|uniref:uncharacterized protein LOC135383083 n=1 Tax=Ornithodoros turicata TaxID=34597 RepID=UPI003139949B
MLRRPRPEHGRSPVSPSESQSEITTNAPSSRNSTTGAPSDKSVEHDSRVALREIIDRTPQHRRRRVNEWVRPQVLSSACPKWLDLDYAVSPFPDGRRPSGETCRFSTNFANLDYSPYYDAEDAPQCKQGSSSASVPDQSDSDKRESPSQSVHELTESIASEETRRNEKGPNVVLFVVAAVAMCAIGFSSYHMYSLYAAPKLESPKVFTAPIRYKKIGLVSEATNVSTPNRLEGTKRTNSLRHFYAPGDLLRDTDNSSTSLNDDALPGLTPTKDDYGRHAGERVSGMTSRSNQVRPKATVHWTPTRSLEHEVYPLSTARGKLRITRKRKGRHHTTPHSNKKLSCKTKACERESTYLSTYLDWNVDPCKNFYNFVCSRWKNLHPDFGTTMDTLLAQKYETDLYHLIVRGESSAPDTLKLGQLITTCARKASYETYRTALSEFLRSFRLNEWPFVRDTKNLLNVWKSASLLLRDLGLATIVSVAVAGDPNRENRFIISVGEPSLLFGQYGTKDSRLPNWYSKAVKETLTVVTRAKNTEVLKGILYFSEKLADVTVNRGCETLSTRRYKVVYLKEYSYLTQLLTYVFQNISTVHGRTRILVKSETYLKSLRKAMHSSKPIDILNYIGFRAIMHISPLLEDKTKKISTIQMRELSGILQPTWPRWRRCLRMFEHVLPTFYLRTFARMNQHNTNEAVIWASIREIQAALANDLNSATWMSIDDKVMLKNKIANIQMTGFSNVLGHLSYQPSAARTWPMLNHRNAISIYVLLAKEYFRQQLSKILHTRKHVASEWKGSVFDTEPSFDAESKVIFIPSIMFDQRYLVDNETALLQIPRVTTKLLGALFQAMHQYNYPKDRLTWSVDTLMGYHDVQKCVQKHYELESQQKIRNGVTSELNTMNSMSLLVAQKFFSEESERYQHRQLWSPHRKEHHSEPIVLYLVRKGVLPDDGRRTHEATSPGVREER